MSRKLGKSPPNGILTLQERALGLIRSRSGGLYQSELRRLLGIDSSKCSKVVLKMQSSGLIYRERVPASSTFLIHPARAEAKILPARHIDSYLTEIYLLYLMRGTSC